MQREGQKTVDEAMDSVGSDPLCDWKGLKSCVHFPDYYRFLQVSRFSQRLITVYTAERSESSHAIYVQHFFVLIE